MQSPRSRHRVEVRAGFSRYSWRRQTFFAVASSRSWGGTLPTSGSSGQAIRPTAQTCATCHIQCSARRTAALEPAETQPSMNRSSLNSGLQRLGAAISLSVTVTACQPSSAPPAPSRTVAEITPADVRSRIYLVADDSMRGREAGSAGNFSMTSYLAREAARIGLEPGGDNGTFLQTVPMIRRRADSASTLSVDGQPFKLFEDFALARPSASLRFATTLAPSTLQVVYGGRAGDTTVTLSDDAVRGRLVVLDAPLSATGQPTGTYANPAALSISRFPTAAAFAIAALDLVSPAALTSLKGSGVGLSDAGVTPRKLPFGLVV